MDFSCLRRRPLVRTTLNINYDLLAQAKTPAALEHFSLNWLIEEELAQRLRHAMKVGLSTRPLYVPMHHGDGGLATAAVDDRGNRRCWIPRMA